MSLTETRELAAQRTMERILDAAERSIGKKGFSAATLADIATEAGVSKGLVNYHFSSKEQLLLEVQARVFRRIAAIVRRLAEEGRPSLPTALAALDRVWEILQLSREQVPFTLELWGQATRRPELRERLDRFTLEMTALMREGIEATTGPTARRFPIPPARLAPMLVPLLSGLAIHAYFAPADTVAAAYRDFRTLLERALEPDASRAPEEER